MRSLIGRNLRLYVRDRGAVFFSFLTVGITIALYALFLKKAIFGGMMESALPEVQALADHWMLGGLVAVSTVTTTLGALGVMVEDRTKHIERDFETAPLSRAGRMGGYLLSACVVGLLMSGLTLALAQGYLAVTGGSPLPAAAVLASLGVTALCVLAGASILFFVVAFLKTQGAFVSVSIIVGTVIGFLMGVYVPVGTLPQGVQAALRWFPLLHGASLFRRIFTAEQISDMTRSMPGGEAAQLTELLGIRLTMFGSEVKPWVSVVFLLGTALVFCLISLPVLAARSRKQA